MGIRKFSLLLFFLSILLIKGAFALDISRYRFHLMPDNSYYGGIQSITKDSLGRIWYTGPDAVFMYDGNSFYQLNDVVSASNPKVKWAYGTLITDKGGRLFLATNHGLLQFNYERFSFDLIVPGRIRSLCLNNDGNLYMLSGESVFWYNQKSKKTQQLALPTHKYFNNIISLNGNIYVAQENLLYKIEKGMRRFVLFADFTSLSNITIDAIEFNGSYYFLTQRGGIYITDTSGNIKKNILVSAAKGQPIMSKKLFLDQSGIIWIATQAGLFLFDPVNEHSSLLKMNLNDAFSLPNNSIWTIYPDPDQGAWIGTYGGKIAYCSLYDAYVRYFNPSPGGLNHPVVSTFQEDDSGSIWIGTEGVGLNYWNRADDSFRYFLKASTNSVNSNIKRMQLDQERKHLFISTFNSGILAYNVAQKTFSDLNFLSPISKQPLSAYDFVLDEQGTWWMTDPDKTFFYRRKKQGGTEIVRMIGTNGKPLDAEIETLYIDEQGHLRLISHQGLFVVERNSLKVLQHYFIKNGPYAVNHLNCYFRAANGDVWLGTSGRGINILKKDGRYINFNSKNGFPPKTVFAILEDEGSKNVWFSTSDGLYYYDQKTEKFEKARFYRENSCGSFYIRSAYKTKKRGNAFWRHKWLYTF